MSLDIQIEVLPEPELIFAAGKSGVEPRAMMMRYGAARQITGQGHSPRHRRTGCGNSARQAVVGPSESHVSGA
jgi:hypothetical protein